ncbi:hypothetical protein PIB30_045820 [Stylosanthes scabra]|uniref:Uncharacterized protein n=1 Tax=Stylosanthes scabra TaxID=79078 RepID=A0ABU6SGR1_9FABA|nr:hypothetical protein [Stylosanthes scabra]
MLSPSTSTSKKQQWAASCKPVNTTSASDSAIERDEAASSVAAAITTPSPSLTTTPTPPFLSLITAASTLILYLPSDGGVQRLGLRFPGGGALVPCGVGVEISLSRYIRGSTRTRLHPHPQSDLAAAGPNHRVSIQPPTLFEG